MSHFYYAQSTLACLHPPVSVTSNVVLIFRDQSVPLELRAINTETHSLDYGVLACKLAHLSLVIAHIGLLKFHEAETRKAEVTGCNQGFTIMPFVKKYRATIVRVFVK